MKPKRQKQEEALARQEKCLSEGRSKNPVNALGTINRTREKLGLPKVEGA